MPLNIRTYHELTEPDRSGLPGQIATQRRRVAERLAGVGRVVAAKSGKGGVGKSFATAGLARAMARGGRAAGVLDADFNGPTIPALLHLPVAGCTLRENAIEPAVSAEGVRCSGSGRTWSTARSRGAPAKSWPASSGCRYWHASRGTRRPMCGKVWRAGCEIPLRRMRPADAVRGAAAPRGRHARGGVPVSPVRPRRGAVDESDGDAAGGIAGREDRRHDDRPPAARNGARDGDDGARRCL